MIQTGQNGVLSVTETCMQYLTGVKYKTLSLIMYITILKVSCVAMAAVKYTGKAAIIKKFVKGSVRS